MRASNVLQFNFQVYRYREILLFIRRVLLFAHA